MLQRSFRERFEDFVGYYRYLDNWHNLPVLRRILCVIGRHDFELEQVKQGEVTFWCYQCGKRKRTGLLS